MKILHVISGLKRGGAETQLFRICQFDRDNVHVVVSLSNKEGYGDILEKINVSVYALNFSSGKINISGLFKLYRIIKQSKPDVIQTWMNHADLIGGIIARIAGIKNIFWGVHQTILIKGKSKASTIMIVRLNAILSNLIPNKIIYCAEKSREVHELIGFKKSIGEVIQNGYDIKIFHQNDSLGKDFRDKLKLSQDTFIIGHVASYDPLKDQDTLIRSLGNLLQRKIKFKAILVGTNLDHSNEDLVNSLKNNGLLNNVHLLGIRDDILSVMNAIDLFLLSSISEAFPNVLNEAMLCGTPCLTTNVGDAAVIVDKTGWVVEPRDSIAMADACIDAITEKEKNNEYWKNRKESCRKRIIENFSFDKMINKYNEVWTHDV